MKSRYILSLFIILAIATLFLAGCGSNSGNQANNGSQVKTEKYPCPDLSSMNLSVYESATQKGIAYPVSYNQGNIEVIYSSGYGPIYCNAGSEKGQNTNWVYCGDFLSPITAQYSDTQGNIVKKRSVQVTFDKNTKEYLATNCDTYNLI